MINLREFYPLCWFYCEHIKKPKCLTQTNPICGLKSDLCKCISVIMVYVNQFFGVLAPPLTRSSWCHDLCLVYQGHGHVCTADDVLHHAAGGLLHRLDLRRRHNTDAVLPENPVSSNLTFSLNDFFVTQVDYRNGSFIKLGSCSYLHPFPFLPRGNNV